MNIHFDMMVQGDQRLEISCPLAHPRDCCIHWRLIYSTTAPCTSQDTGESTYDPPPGGLTGGFEGGGGVLVEGGEGSASSSSGWIKYYDAEYAVDYYFNVRCTHSSSSTAVR